MNENIGLWTFVSTVATSGLLWVAWVQLKNISQTARADFNHKFTERFFTQECRDLLMLFDYELIKFRVAKISETREAPFFEVDQHKLTNSEFIDHKHKENLKKIYSEYEIDDHLLGHFEDIGLYHKDGLLDMNMVNEVFGGYIESLWEDSEVKEYIWWVRKNVGEDRYTCFEHIYGEVKGFRPKSNIDMALKVAGAIFLIIACIHLIRLLFRVKVLVGSLTVPLWGSGIAVIILLGLALWYFKLTK